MLIVGAKGFAKEILESLAQLNRLQNVAFFDDVNIDGPNFLYDEFPVYKSLPEVVRFFERFGPDFVLGVGNPKVRKMLCEKIERVGGVVSNVISPKASIGSFGTTIGNGATIMTGTIITNDVTVGLNCLINLNSTIGHDTIIGDYVEICPGVNVSGNCLIKDNVFLGSGATILPNVIIGENSIIAAGTVVLSDVPANVTVAGVPASIKKYNHG